MKAAFQNRQGPPLLQGYYDLAKLLRKEPVRSDVVVVGLRGRPARLLRDRRRRHDARPVARRAARPSRRRAGSCVLVGLLALGRFALATAALDTGSPFGGMGASREMTVGALAEPALMLGLFTVALWGGSLNLGELVRAHRRSGASRPTRASCSPPPPCSSSSSPRRAASRWTTPRRTSS